jgi:hypothetical protein
LTHLFRGVCVRDGTGGQLAENPSIYLSESVLTGCNWWQLQYVQQPTSQKVKTASRACSERVTVDDAVMPKTWDWGSPAAKTILRHLGSVMWP